MSDSEMHSSYKKPIWSGAPKYSFRLEVIKEGSIVGHIPIVTEKEFCTFGRDPRVNDVEIAHPSSSREHAAIQMRSTGEVFLYDMNSTHGTFLNKKRLQPTIYYKIISGDQFSFGASSRQYLLLGGPTRDEVEGVIEAHRDEKLQSLLAARLKSKANQSGLDHARGGGDDASSFGDSLDEQDKKAKNADGSVFSGSMDEAAEFLKKQGSKGRDAKAQLSRGKGKFEGKQKMEFGPTAGEEEEIGMSNERVGEFLGVDKKTRTEVIRRRRMEEARLRNIEKRKARSSVQGGGGAGDDEGEQEDGRGLEADEEERRLIEETERIQREIREEKEYASDEDEFFDRTIARRRGLHGGQVSGSGSASASGGVLTAESLDQEQQMLHLKREELRFKIATCEDGSLGEFSSAGAPAKSGLRSRLEDELRGLNARIEETALLLQIATGTSSSSLAAHSSVAAQSRPSPPRSELPSRPQDDSGVVAVGDGDKAARGGKGPGKRQEKQSSSKAASVGSSLAEGAAVVETEDRTDESGAGEPESFDLKRLSVGRSGGTVAGNAQDKAQQPAQQLPFISFSMSKEEKRERREKRKRVRHMRTILKGIRKGERSPPPPDMPIDAVAKPASLPRREETGADTMGKTASTLSATRQGADDLQSPPPPPPPAPAPTATAAPATKEADARRDVPAVAAPAPEAAPVAAAAAPVSKSGRADASEARDLSGKGVQGPSEETDAPRADGEQTGAEPSVKQHPAVRKKMLAMKTQFQEQRAEAQARKRRRRQLPVALRQPTTSFEDYDWVPPTNQAGDGTTSLNKRMGY